MKYRSTRGQVSGQGFESVVLEGLASDGGLYIPEELPTLPQNWEKDWTQKSFPELATELISLFVGDDLSHDEVAQLVTKSYSTFDTKEVTPLVDLDESTNTHILELFHGPTFAFKDVALQFLGNLFEFFLERRNNNKQPGDTTTHRITVVGATSGDTGSAAIYGLRGKKNVSVFILHPKGRVSPIQEAQMTTVLDPNVHNVSIEGTFDDCQDIVKQLFGRADFKRDHSLGAINSINWARILAQITYYFHAYFTLLRNQQGSNGQVVKPPVFVVPSGNFGDILAGYYARSLGLPVGKLVIATNANDILDRFLESGKYEKNSEKGVLATPSPAMDILVSSNFERFLWYLARDHQASSPDEAGQVISQWMEQLKTAGSFTVSDQALQAARGVFWSGSCNNQNTYATIAKYYGQQQRSPYLLDPHTAVGVYVAEQVRKDIDKNTHTICLSTAHPAKFSEAVLKAINDHKGQHLDFQSILPSAFVGLLEKPRRCLDCDNSADAVAQLIVEHEK